MRVDVLFTPAEHKTLQAEVAIVVDVLRATSTVAQALAAGYRRVICCAEVEQAFLLRESLGEGLLAGERRCLRIPGFDFGNSPSEFLVPQAETLILSTTNGTGALVLAASASPHVLAGSLLNLEAVTARARELSDSVTVVCAGVLGGFTLDDACCAGRIVERLGGERTDAAEAAVRIAASFPTPIEGLRLSRSGRNLTAAGLAADIELCARESVLDTVPRVVRIDGPAVELGAWPLAADQPGER